MNLKDWDQWLLWTFRDGRKVPLTRHGQSSGCNRPEDFMSWQEANEAVARLAVQGPAFVFTSDDPFVGIDLDDCLLDDSFKEWVKPILEKFAGTYIEFSPSLTGLKIFCQGEKGSRPSSASVGDGRVEVYDSGRFFTYTGFACTKAEEATEKQEAIDWLFEQFFTKPPESVARTVTTVPVAWTGLTSRAADYVRAAERPLPGARNSSAFRLAGHLFALEHEGELLTDSAVESLVAEWNASLPAPLPEAEISAVVRSAAKNGTPRNLKPSLAVQPDPGIDLSGILGPPEAKPATKEEVRFPEEILAAEGFLGAMTRYMCDSALYPQPQLAFAASLSLLSVLTGRKVQDDHFATRTNVYCLGIAPTGAGKEHARRCAKQLLVEIGAGELIGSERIGSSAGLVQRLVADPACLFLLDEFGQLLATTQSARTPHLFNIRSVLMQLFSSAGTYWVGDAYADRSRTPQIDDPHCVIYGTTTEDVFWGSLSTANVSDGLLGRLLLFEGEYVDMTTPSAEEIPAECLERAQAWHQCQGAGSLGGVVLRPSPLILSYSADGFERLAAHLAQISERRKAEESTMAALWSRTGERTAKLAMLFACSRQMPGEGLQISLGDVDSAVALSNWITRRILHEILGRLAENEHERSVLRVLRVIREAKKPMSTREITRKTQWLRHRDRNEILTSLLQSGQIRHQGHGRLDLFEAVD